MPILLKKLSTFFYKKYKGLRWINPKTIKNIKQKHVIETHKHVLDKHFLLPKSYF